MNLWKTKLAQSKPSVYALLLRDQVDPAMAVESGVRFYRTTKPEAAVEAARCCDVDVTILKAPPTLEILHAVAEPLGGTRNPAMFDTVRDIRVDPAKTRSVAESSAAHDMHTDGTFESDPPNLFILQFVETDPNGGGVSLFASVPAMRSRMPEVVEETLATAEVCFSRHDERREKDDAAVTTILDASDGRFRWRDDHEVCPRVVDPKGKDVQAAIDWVRGYLRSCSIVSYAASRGDLILVNNMSVLHGRTALSGLGSPRHVRRAWIY